jgi:hypothetical protein
MRFGRPATWLVTTKLSVEDDRAASGELPWPSGRPADRADTMSPTRLGRTGLHRRARYRARGRSRSWRGRHLAGLARLRLMR